MRTATQALPQAAPAKKFVAGMGIVFSVFYLLNPSSGIIELIPDLIPGIGNIDETSVVLLLLACLKVFRQDQPNTGR